MNMVKTGRVALLLVMAVLFASGLGAGMAQAARTGARAVFAGAVGTDAFGQVVLDRLVADGVSELLAAQDRPVERRKVS